MPAPRRPGRGDAAVADAPLDALIVGAGPTGLALAVQLRGFGVRFRIVDRLLDRARESRALAIQARTLEVLDGVGLGERLAAAGRTSTRLMLHFGARVAEAELGGFRVAGTRYPFILFLSQAETERILNEHLAAAGVRVERGVELVGFRAGDVAVECTLRHGDGREERVRAAYLVGCDGAHSTVRKGAGIPFEGGTYLQDFALGDVEADGPLARDTIHSFAGRGVAMFFPLGSPTTWRVIAMAPDGAGAAREAPVTSGLPLDELQAMVDGATGGTVRLHDPAWLTHFRLHHRQTARYRAGRVFLAGDAAHIHSPVGAQGMNTGIQDAWNLGWKLALVARGRAGDALLDTYEAERWPVGHALLRTTDRVFGLFTRAMSAGAAAAWFRRTVVARVLPRVLRSTRLRAFAFGFVSQLRIRYRASPLAAEGSPAPGRGPKAGDRLPDAPVVRDGRATHLQKELAGPCLHLLLCGEPDRWDRARLAELTARYGGLVRVDGLVRGDGGGGALVDEAPGALVDRTGDARTDGARGALIDGAANAPVDGSGGAIDGSGRVIDGAGGARTDGTLGTLVDGAPGALVDRTGEAFERLGVDDAALYLVRPDGYIGFRSAGYELQGVGEYLARWFRACAPDGT